MVEDSKKRHKKDDEVKTMFHEKHVVEKNGRRLEYSSIDEMPADVREFHEEVQAILNGKTPEHFKKGGLGVSTTTTTTTYHYKGKNYEKIEDIPDESTRAKMRIAKQLMDGRSPQTLKGKKFLINHNGNVREFDEELKKEERVWCPGCGNQVIPQKKLFGKYKCPECKMKWDPDEVV